MNIKLLRTSSLNFIALILLSALNSPVMSSQNEHSSKQASVNAPIKTPSREAYIDEATGELISPPADNTNLSNTSPDNNAGLQKKQQDIKYITHPDGMREGQLNGQFQSQLLVTMDCHGNLTQAHSDESSHADGANHIESCDSDK